MSDGLREIDLDDADQGLIKILHPIPRVGDHWGVLAPLRDTVWGSQIQTVTAEAMSHALHGWATPLARELKTEPRVCARRVPVTCALQKGCLGFKAPTCRPGMDVPDCYEAPNLGAATLLATRIALAWREGRHVVVVEGEGFSLS